jgi:hypothetical protein
MWFSDSFNVPKCNPGLVIISMIIWTYLPLILMVLSVLCHPLLQEVPAMMELIISALGRKYHPFIRSFI